MSQFVEEEYLRCMECDTPGSPKSVLRGGLGVEVRRKESDELVGYLHGNCKAAWVRKHGEDDFSFRRF